MRRDDGRRRVLLGARQRGAAREAALRLGLVFAGIVVFVLAAPRARAERLVPWRAMVAGSLHWGGRGGTSDVRAYGGYVYSEDVKGDGSRFFVGGGVAGAVGRALVKDPRGIDGVVGTWRWWVGPELRLGTATVDKEPHRAVDFYLAFAPMLIRASTLSDRLPEAGGAFGMRAALGLAAPRSWPMVDQFLPGGGSCDGGLCGIGLFFLLLPNTIEASYERSASANRFGVVLGYTF